MIFDLRDLPQCMRTSAETLLVFIKTFRDIHTEMEARLSRYGITQGRFMLLKLIYHSSEAHLTPSVLAQQAGITRGTVSGLIDGLERDGLIERKRQQGSDRRVVTVQLTQAGLMLMDQLLPQYLEGMDMLMSEFTLEDRAALINLMDKLKLGLDKVKAANG